MNDIVKNFALSLIYVKWNGIEQSVNIKIDYTYIKSW